MKASELKRWPEICQHLQGLSYVGYDVQHDISVSYDIHTGLATHASLLAADKWGRMHGVDITQFISHGDLEPLMARPLPKGCVPLECEIHAPSLEPAVDGGQPT